ncbi:iron ABC transporter permease (plasmid) [Neorhizobium sp. NCHU2750]|nr:iron ABC transporter permease [Neorhizobium sp. NCHU2750]
MVGSATLLILAAFIALITCRASDLLPPRLWLDAMLSSDPEPRELLFRDSFLPRIVIALMAGGGLALAGTIFQQVLRNPLAEATTLGVSAGAQLALAICMLWWPSLYGAAQGWIALAGAVVAFAFVIWMAASLGFSPSSLIVSGMMVSLISGSLSGLLIILNHDYLSALFIWQSGSLAQNDWAAAMRLLAETVPLAILCILLARPLEIMGLGDGEAKSLGIPVWPFRLLFLAMAVCLGASVTSAVGVIGFIGLASPALVRLLGARTLRERLAYGSLLGSALLLLTDQIVQLKWFTAQEIPTGAATGLLAAPLLIWLMSRARSHLGSHHTTEQIAPRLEDGASRRLLAGAALVLVAGLVLALMVGKTPAGWHLASWREFDLLWPWRSPRVFGALGCGALLAVAGLLLQRMTGNAMASPEVLGVSSGATVAVLLCLMVIPGFDPTWVLPVAGAGAMATVVLLLAISGRSSFSSDRQIFVGIALASSMTAVSSIALTSGDPRTSLLLSWMSGSTYGLTSVQAAFTCLTAAVILVATSFCARWLDVLPLGEPTSQALGLSSRRTRLILLVLACAATAIATLVVGPLSFVGLMAPHMARMFGLQRPVPQLLGAAIFGALIMVVADWFGRSILSPWQLPAGLVASLVGAPYFLWCMHSRKKPS